jgi:inner membrane protein
MRTSPIARLGIMGLLFLVLLVPLTMMYSVVSERSSRRNQVALELSNEWGGSQMIGGPVLVVPYRHSWTDTSGHVQRSTAQAYFLPEALIVDGTVLPEERKRTLFTVTVYTAAFKIRGRFAPPDLSRARPAAEEILWDEATLSLGVSDPKGISRPVDLAWNAQRQPFMPGVSGVGLFEAGVQAPARGLLPTRTEPIPFELELEVRGTRELWFLPSGNETVVQLSSRWPHPKFSGAALPQHTTDQNGFKATWRVPYFGRGYPPVWYSQFQNKDQLKSQASASAFGVALVNPVDIYSQTERAVKYAALFIVLTFVIAFLWEITGGVLVHPVQYLFVGFALCVFYLLLLSVAEHWGFDRAYALGSTATVGLLAWYWSWVLSGRRQGTLMGAALTTLYGYLYLLLRLEDYALLAGSVGLFAMLALVMFLTRRVNWYNLRLGTGDASGNPSS